MLNKEEQVDTKAEQAKGQEPQTGGNRGARLRQRALEISNEETVFGLEQVFEAKLAAVRAYEQRMATIADPYARKALQQMIAQERQELLSLAELIELMEKSPDMGRISRLQRQFNHQIKANTGRSMGFWLGAAVVGAMMLPSVREAIKPMALKAVHSVMEISDQAQGLFSGVREDIEDLVAEAQFEKFKQSIDAAVEQDIPLPGGQDNNFS